MTFKKLTQSEEELVKLVWESDSIKSSELVKLCEEKFNWKKSTTYTILKRAEKKGVIENNNSTVKPCISEDEYNTNRGLSFLDKHFGGSLPKFITAFSRENTLDEKDIEELEKLIEKYKEDAK
ncbi:MAG: BlaI/MecI/CopY family transcriptional regulator [Tissierellia bacterium]|nr:BlaI/MecI/CopY family transcriptional regulator [Tissierellia bacterium]